MSLFEALLQTAAVRLRRGQAACGGLSLRCSLNPENLDPAHLERGRGLTCFISRSLAQADSKTPCEAGCGNSMAESSMFALKTAHVKKILLSAMAALSTYPAERLARTPTGYACSARRVSEPQQGTIQFVDPDDLQMNSNS